MIEIIEAVPNSNTRGHLIPPNNKQDSTCSKDKSRTSARPPSPRSMTRIFILCWHKNPVPPSPVHWSPELAVTQTNSNIDRHNLSALLLHSCEVSAKFHWIVLFRKEVAHAWLSSYPLYILHCHLKSFAVIWSNLNGTQTYSGHPVLDGIVK